MSVISRSNDLPSDWPVPIAVAVLTDDLSVRDFFKASKEFEVANPEISAWSANAIELAIVDCPTLIRYEHDIRRMRDLPASEQPILFLVIDEADIPEYQTWLGNLVDDLIRHPFSPIEFRARSHRLLRHREPQGSISHEVAPVAPAQKGVPRASQALRAGNDRTIRACSEQEILNNICKSLTCEGGYPLAWVGQRLSNTDRSIKPVSVSGSFSGLIPHLFSGDQQDLQLSSPMIHSFETGRMNQTVLPQALCTDESKGPKAVIVFPLTQRDEQPSTCLAIYSPEPELFTDNEIDLLRRFVDNALTGIYALREKFNHRRREREALRLAYRDGLTGLPNRSALLKTLDQRLEEPGPYPPSIALLYLDLDGFKLINDALGHAAGDSVLIEVSRRLKSEVGESGFVARNGGDEFVILLPLGSPRDFAPYSHTFDHVRNVVQNLLHELSKPFQIEGHDYHIESSIGMGLCPAHAQNAFGLLIKAESAMFEAKKISGGSFEVYSVDLSERRQKRLEMESHLHLSVQNREFEIALQPIVDLTDGRIKAAETLLRWPQADGSYISPAEFIPIAEESGLIVAIGDWVMEASIRALSRLRAQGFIDLQITVNLAIAQLWESDLVEKTVSFMNALMVPTGALKIELTEGSLMRDIDHMEDVVEKFRSAGIEVAIDDFGTGYSSLSRLKSLPITTLKIDRSFLTGVPDDAGAVSVVTTIAQMAKNLGIQSIAEGIETEAQWHFLRDLGCPMGQGFYFARPMAEKDFSALMQRQQDRSAAQR